MVDNAIILPFAVFTHREGEESAVRAVTAVRAGTVRTARAVKQS